MEYMVIERKNVWEGDKLTMLLESKSLDECIAHARALENIANRVVFIMQWKGVAIAGNIVMFDDDMNVVEQYPFAE